MGEAFSLLTNKAVSRVYRERPYIPPGSWWKVLDKLVSKEYTARVGGFSPALFCFTKRAKTMTRLKLTPLRKIISRKYTSRQTGVRRHSTSMVELLTLDCGHEIESTSNPKARARCYVCEEAEKNKRRNTPDRVAAREKAAADLKAKREAEIAEAKRKLDLVIDSFADRLEELQSQADRRKLVEEIWTTADRMGMGLVTMDELAAPLDQPLMTGPDGAVMGHEFQRKGKLYRVESVTADSVFAFPIHHRGAVQAGPAIRFRRP